MGYSVFRNVNKKKRYHPRCDMHRGFFHTKTAGDSEEEKASGTVEITDEVIEYVGILGKLGPTPICISWLPPHLMVFR